MESVKFQSTAMVSSPLPESPVGKKTHRSTTPVSMNADSHQGGINLTSLPVIHATQNNGTSTMGKINNSQSISISPSASDPTSPKKIIVDEKFHC